MCVWLGERSDPTCVAIQIKDGDGVTRVISTDAFDPIPSLDDL